MEKNLPAKEGDARWIPGWGTSPEGGNGDPFQYSCLGNSKDKRAIWIHGATREDMTEHIPINTHTHTTCKATSVVSNSL